MSDLTQLKFPGIYAQIAKTFAEQREYSLATAFRLLDIPESVIDDPNAYLTGEQIKLLLRIARYVLPKKRPVSFEILEQFQFNTLGLLGLVVSSSPDAATALDVISQHYRDFLPSVEVFVTEEQDLVRIQLDSIYDFEEVDKDIYEIALGAFDSIFRQLNGESQRSICFSYVPDYSIEVYEQFYGCDISFGTPNTRMEFKKSLLSLKMPSANLPMFNMLNQQLQEQYQMNRSRSSFKEKARSILFDSCKQGIVLNREQLAQRLAVSHRTLTRRLKEEGVSYQVLSDEVRETLARKLLICSDKSLTQIASAVGMENGAAFSRAFKKWTGESPSAFRDSRK